MSEGMEEMPIDAVPSEPARPSAAFAPLGEPVTPEEVTERLSANLYDQLSEKDDEITARAISRAEVYIGVLLRYKGQILNLDDKVVRELVLMQTVYEMHIALGHEEAGREYRHLMKNTFMAVYGSFPDSDDDAAPALPMGAITKPSRRRRWRTL
jgi:hypothetical protein